MPTPVAARSKVRIWGRSLGGSADSNPTASMDASLVSVVCCQVEVSATIPIPRPEGSYRVCVVECDQLQPLHLQRARRQRSRLKKKEGKKKIFSFISDHVAEHFNRIH